MKRTVTCGAIEADKPTINGRTYPKHVLESFVEECNELGEVLVADDLDGFSLNLSRVAARASDFALDPNGRIVATLELLDTPSGNVIKQILDHVEFSPMVIGTVNDQGVIQDDAKVAYFALTLKDQT